MKDYSPAVPIREIPLLRTVETSTVPTIGAAGHRMTRTNRGRSMTEHGSCNPRFHNGTEWLVS